MKARSILRSSILFALIAGTCSNNPPIVLTRADPPLIRNTEPFPAFHIIADGGGFLQSSNLISQSLVQGVLEGARVLSDTDVLVTIYANPGFCGPVTVQLGNINNSAVVSTTDLISFYAATADFQGATSVPSVGSAIGGIATGNFNPQPLNESGTSDPFTDLAVTLPADNIIQVRLGSDNGLVQGVSNATPTNIMLDPATHGSPSAIVAANFDTNENVDLAIIDRNASQDQVSLLLGKGDGTFQAPTVIYTTSATGKFQTLVVGQLHSDPANLISQIGLVYVDAGGATQLVFLQRQGDGSFQPAAPPLRLLVNGMTFQSIAVGNFDNDPNHNLDVALAIAQKQTLTFFLGQGNGTFQMTAPVTLSFTPQAIVAQDYNSDKIQDLVAVDGTNRFFEVLLGRGSSLPSVQQKNGQEQQFSVTNPATFVGKGNFVTTGDFNGDRKPDVVVANNDNSIGFFLSQCPVN